MGKMQSLCLASCEKERGMFGRLGTVSYSGFRLARSALRSTQISPLDSPSRDAPIVSDEPEPPEDREVGGGKYCGKGKMSRSLSRH